MYSNQTSMKIIKNYLNILFDQKFDYEDGNNVTDVYYCNENPRMRNFWNYLIKCFFELFEYIETVLLFILFLKHDFFANVSQC